MTEDNPVKPQSEVLFLLGGLNAKMDSVLGTQQSYDARLSKVEVAIAELKVTQPTPRPPWYSVVGGISGLGATVLAAVALLKVLNP